MKRNNINLITNDGNRFKYVVEIDEIENRHRDFNILYKSVVNKTIIPTTICMEGENPVIREVNKIHTDIDCCAVASSQDNLESIKASVSRVKVFIPDYKPELFDKGIKYLVEVFVDIERERVFLHSGIHDINENLANEHIFRLNENDYFEYFYFDIANPYEILFGDDFDEFRKRIEDIDYNITSSIINISIIPLDANNVIHNYVNSGSTNLQINNESDMFLRAILRPNTNISTSSPAFEISWEFNTAYAQNSNGLREYLHETYFIPTGDDAPMVRYELIFFDKEKHVFNRVIEYDEKIKYNYKFNYYECLLGWEHINDGVLVKCRIHLITRDTYDDIQAQIANAGKPETEFKPVYDFVMEIPSTTFPLVPETYKYFATDKPLFNIKLDSIEMKNYNFNIVNKVQRNIITLERPTDYKANIIKPVYYKVRETSNLNINPAVSENICLNLDAYKSTTDLFHIQVEGVIFNEIGRTSAGIIFKIVGNKLPHAIETGTYYILDKNNEMITSGTFTYK